MKQNWWKLLVVVALVVAVAVVLAGKDQDAGRSADNAADQVAAKSDLDEPVDGEPAQAEKQLGVQNTERTDPTAAKDAPKAEAKADAVAVPESKPTGPQAGTGASKATEAAVKPVAKPVVEKKSEKPALTAKREETAPRKLPKMVELGADRCVPCKMMKPIIEELQRDYKGKLDVVFIDVWKDESAAEKYSVQSIPTQIFLDEDGKEFFRHIGFFAKEDILKTFEDQGIKL